MTYEVILLEEADRDLISVYEYLKRHATKSIAFREIERFETACMSLQENPERGSIPKELPSGGNFNLRQLIVKEFRIFYKVIDNKVVIYGIIHGRRNIRDLLIKRALLIGKR
jgi:toxin ParE1/3/4